jgi:hypothetical protein
MHQRPPELAEDEPDAIAELNHVDDGRFRLGLRLMVAGIRATLDLPGRGDATPLL